MNGPGIMATSSGLVLFGSWVNDQPHGEFVQSIGLSSSTKTVVEFEHGEVKNRRDYDGSQDWTEIEAPARDAMKRAEEASEDARLQLPAIGEVARRSKESQV